MTSNDQAIFLELMIRIGVLYKQPMQELLMEMYWIALQRFELSAVKEALQAHVNHPDRGQYLPKPADLVWQLEGSTQTKALRAWSRVIQAIREVGGYSSVVFDDPLIHAVITEMGGWVRLCQMLVSELPFRGHDFVALYVGYAGCPPRHYPRALIGMLTQQNRLSIPQWDMLICIGDRQKAWQVYQQGESTQKTYSPLVLQGAEKNRQ